MYEHSEFWVIAFLEPWKNAEKVKLLIFLRTLTEKEYIVVSTRKSGLWLHQQAIPPQVVWFIASQLAVSDISMLRVQATGSFYQILNCITRIHTSWGVTAFCGTMEKVQETVIRSITTGCLAMDGDSQVQATHARTEQWLCHTVECIITDLCEESRITMYYDVRRELVIHSMKSGFYNRGCDLWTDRTLIKEINNCSMVWSKSVLYFNESTVQSPIYIANSVKNGIEGGYHITVNHGPVK